MSSRAATQVLDAGWRAAAYCLHPRVIGWSLLPLALAVALSFGMAWFFWKRGVLGTIVCGMAVYLPLRLGLGW